MEASERSEEFIPPPDDEAMKDLNFKKEETMEDSDSASMKLAIIPFRAPGFSEKRGKGRPRGSGKRQLLSALGEWFALSAGGNFTPHVVFISAGEDVAARILSFSQKGPRAICILAANGSISNVTLRQPSSCGGLLTYEGSFEIVSLSGSFTLSEDGGSRNRTGGLNVLLARPDGRVVGGVVAGSLLAASPIQVVVGSFTPNTLKAHKRRTATNQDLPVFPAQARPCSFEAADNNGGTPVTSILPVSQKLPDNANPVHAFSMVGNQASGFPSTQQRAA